MIEIKKNPRGYTAITYKGVEIAKHFLSTTNAGTKEAFEIDEDTNIDSFFEERYKEEIEEINLMLDYAG